jgi:ribosomal silencing factor RsfS
LARIIVDLASDKKGENMVLMDMRNISPITIFSSSRAVAATDS